jgi:hypothetical protein
MVNGSAPWLVSVTVFELALPMEAAEPKLSVLGLATNGLAVADASLVAPLGSPELHPDNNKLSKIAEKLRHSSQFLRLPDFARNLLTGELVTMYRLLKFMSRDK